MPTGIRPYGDIGLLILGFGFLSLIVGLVLLIYQPQAKTKVVYVPLKKCPKCGKQYSVEEFEYCPTCGIELEPA
jgi:rRNA maturation endonuclease Nob1